MQPAHHVLPHHFTASGLVVCQRHILLVNHKRIGAWVPPGGHIEETEIPEQTVVREIFEETGIHVDVLTEPIPQTGNADAFFLAMPFYVQSVLAIERGERFYHLDLAYLCRPAVAIYGDSLPPLSNNDEVNAASWVKLTDAHELLLANNVKEALEKLSETSVVARFSQVADVL